MKIQHLILVVFIAGLHFIQCTAQETLFVQTETRYWDESGAHNGYTMFGVGGRTYLVDMEGLVVNQWNIGTNPRFTIRNTLLDATHSDPSRFEGWQELDWDGNVLWSYNETRDGYEPHHDWVLIYNKALEDYSFLYIANKSLTEQLCLDAGCDPAYSKNYDKAQMDVIVEVDKEGNIIWEWWFFDHTCQDLDASKDNYVADVSQYPGKIDLNMPGKPVKKDWLHCNSLDYNDQTGHIVINSVHGELYVIDHDGTFLKDDPEGSIELAASDAGDFLYRFGDPARYGQGDPPSVLEDWTASTTGHKQMGGAHDAQWIREGLPGEGNILVFNNGQYLWERTPQSYIFEINPYIENIVGSVSTEYVNPPDAGYYEWRSENHDTHKQTKNMSNQISWIYSSLSNQTFFSHIGSGAQRLENGNTLICAMTEGHVFEVTAEGELVWEYICPITRDGIKRIKTDNYPTYNAIFRAYRYTSEHPALVGKDLSPGESITGEIPDYHAPEGSTGNQLKSTTLNEGMSMNFYPNPGSEWMNIEYAVPEYGRVRIAVYNQTGQQIRILEDRYQAAGQYQLQWDTQDEGGQRVQSGIYFQVLELNGKRISKRVIVVR